MPHAQRKNAVPHGGANRGAPNRFLQYPPLRTERTAGGSRSARTASGFVRMPPGCENRTAVPGSRTLHGETMRKSRKIRTFAENPQPMQITKAEFRCSSERISQVPKDTLPDIAFIGRSNVGKSSLINMLTGRQGLAKVSGTPGKTKLVNHFLINGKWYLVDLPGYGYARTSKSVRNEFSKLITDYVLRCQKLHYLFVLVDIRLEPQKIDLRFIGMLGRNGVPFGIVFTKADKLSRTQVERSVARYRAALEEEWEELPPMLVSSSERGTGRDEILDFIGACLSNVPETR